MVILDVPLGRVLPLEVSAAQRAPEGLPVAVHLPVDPQVVHGVVIGAALLTLETRRPLVNLHVASQFAFLGLQKKNTFY